MLKESGEFVINLTTEQLAKATDYCGVRSGKDVDKWKEAHLTPAKAEKLQYAPVIEECPVNIESYRSEKTGKPPYVSGGSSGSTD
jgi:flavin reductase (DIM6/NTAB) family NADH-FMN oxidoreductase RutF